MSHLAQILSRFYANGRFHYLKACQLTWNGANASVVNQVDGDDEIVESNRNNNIFNAECGMRRTK